MCKKQILYIYRLKKEWKDFMIYTNKYKIRIEDIGADNEASNKALLAIMEDVAGLHSALAGYGVFDIQTKKRVWMLLDWQIKVLKRPQYNDEIEAETWSRKFERLCAYRDFYIKDKDGNIIVKGTSRWLLIDTDRRRPVRLTNEIADLYKSEEGKMVFPEEIQDIKYDDYMFKKEYLIQRRDIDMNEHVHNLSYLDMAYEAIPQEVYKNNIFDNVRIIYKKEISYGEKVYCYYLKKENKHIITVKSQEKINAVIELY